MKEEILQKAKDLFSKRFYSVKNMLEDEIEEWKSYDVPYEIVKKWVIEVVESDLSEMYESIEINKQYAYIDKTSIEKFSLLTNLLSILLSYVSEYNLEEYYEKIIDLIGVFAYDAYSLVSEAYYDGWEYKYCYFELLLTDYEVGYYRRNFEERKLFDTKEAFVGLLPLLYKKGKRELFERLLGYIYIFIENAGVYNQSFLIVMYNYAKYLNDSEIIDKTIDSIKKCKKHYFTLYPNWKMNFFQELLLEKELEVESIKNSYYLSKIRDIGLHNPFNHLDEAKSSLNILGINEEIIKKWEDGFINHLNNVLTHIDDYMEWNFDFVSKEEFSDRYVKYLIEKANLSQIWSNWLCYYMKNMCNNEENQLLLNDSLIRLMKKDKLKDFIFYIDLSNRFISLEGNSGWLVKYYNEKNDVLFETYFELAIRHIKTCGYSTQILHGMKKLLEQAFDLKIVSKFKELGLIVLQNRFNVNDGNLLLEYCKETKDDDYFYKIESIVESIQSEYYDLEIKDFIIVQSIKSKYLR